MHTLYIGTYTQTLPYVHGKGEGIYRLEMNTATGALSTPMLAVRATNPSFLALDAAHRRLFAVHELEQWRGRAGGAVGAFAVLPDGGLKLLNQRGSGGAAPCYLSLAPSGEAVLAANYASGTVSRLAVVADGRLRPAASIFAHEGCGPDPKRQEAPHAHAIAPDPGGRWALATDLGADKLYIYRLGRRSLQPFGALRLRPGAGPRHFAFSADGRCLYLANELDSTVSFLAFDPQAPRLELVQTVSALTLRPVPGAASPGGQANTLADLHLHPSGRFLYASNRGEDTLAVFAVAPDGTLSAAGHVPSGGRTPRNFALTPDGRYLVAANQDSDTLVVFELDPTDGMPRPIGSVAQVPTPVCVVVG